MVAQGDCHRGKRSPGPLSWERSGEDEHARLRDLVILPSDLDESVRADSTDRISAEGTVVHVHENADDVVSEDRWAVVRADVHADRASRIGRRECVRDRHVEPQVRASWKSIVHDSVSVVVSVRPRVGDPIVVEVQGEGIHGIRDTISVRVRGSL